MRRTSLLALSVVTLLGVLFAGVSARVIAQDTATPAAGNDHPLIGSWLLNTDPENPDEPLSLVSFAAGGTFIEVDSDGVIGLGAWEATGDTTANLTFSYVDGEGGMMTIRASIVVDAGGRSFTASYTTDLRDPATGEWSGEIGPDTAVGVRMVVESPGTPVASSDEYFTAQGTPEATPAS